MLLEEMTTGRNYRDSEARKKQELQKYIPISILSRNSRIMERIILRTMNEEEERLRTIPNEQCGFRKVIHQDVHIRRRYS